MITDLRKLNSSNRGTPITRSTMNAVLKIILSGAVVACSSALFASSNDPQSLQYEEVTIEEGFRNPPSDAKPRTWLHAMSGNMSKVGMTKDLEAIAAAGQGGVLLFNVANGIPYGDVPYASDEHHSIITHAAAESERLGLSFGVHNCDGWTSSGGPWVTPEQSMKMVTWSETLVEGGDVDVVLSQPTTHEGFYRDIAVLAYPAFDTEIVDAAAKAVVTASDPNFDIGMVTDGIDGDATTLNKRGDGKAWLMFDYGEEREIGAYYFYYKGNSESGILETSNDGVNFTQVKEVKKLSRIGKKKRIFNDQFEPIKARYFRFSFDKSIPVREVKLSLTRPFKNYIGYSGLGNPGSYLDILNPADSSQVIQRESLLDISHSLADGGKLKTTLPKGKWMVLRFGYTSTGAHNWPASKWGLGLECDKFSRPAMKAHFDAFSQKVIDNAKEVAPNAMQYIEIDSYEMGGQNWTDGFASIFEREKGYDIIPFLPLFAGRYVESPEAVAGVAFDLNEVYCDLMTQNYFRYFTELCHENGLKSYIEPYGAGPVSPLDISEFIDLPMTEFWQGRKSQKRLTGTIHGAHVYGKNVISAEAFTARPEVNWKNHPALAKTWGDMAWVAGVNEFMYHRFVHQANTHVEPGLTMGFWGSHFDRTQTWWMNAGVEWFGYHARGSHLLRHGHHAADVLVFVGDIPHKDGYKRNDLAYELPLGINYDCTNANALKDRFSIQNKKLVLPEGNGYSHLVLQESRLMTLATLRRLKEIVDAGVPVIGKKPLRLPGYAVSKKEEREFKKLCDSIWSQPNCVVDFDFSALQPDFAVAGLEKDFIHRRSDDADVYFFYNEEEQPVSYECSFRVANKIPELWDATTGEIKRLARFKSDGDTTRVWLDLEGLESAFVIFRESAGSLASVVAAEAGAELMMTDSNSVSVRTDKEEATSITWSNGVETQIPATRFPDVVALNTDWTVEFLEKHHFASREHFAGLKDWKDHENEDIRYYSGTAIYRKSFDLPESPRGDLRYVLDLGSVDIVAEVAVNGRDVGVLWIAPFELDITDFLREGENALEIEITNQWANRLIGDENYPRHDEYVPTGYNPSPDSRMPDWYINNEPMPAGPRTTFSSHNFYKQGDALEPSGLKGPVAIRYERVVEVSIP